MIRYFRGRQYDRKELETELSATANNLLVSLAVATQLVREREHGDDIWMKLETDVRKFRSLQNELHALLGGL